MSNEMPKGATLAENRDDLVNEADFRENQTGKRNKMKALEVAKYFLLLNQRLTGLIQKEDDNNDDFKTTPDPISHLKIQKLVYYAQGLHLSYFNKPLFNEEIQAWEHGPVTEKLYKELKGYGSNDLMQYFNNIKESDLTLNDNEKEIIQLAFYEYGKYSASGLRNKTHNELPWVSVFKNGKGKGETINLETIKEFFNAELKRKADILYEESKEYRCLFS